MSEDGKRRNLGRGLSALLGEDSTEDYASLDKLRLARMVPVEQIYPGRFQPRRRFDEERIQDLVASIREKGVLQPILVRRSSDPSSFEIIAGERRWRASQAAGLHEVPVIVKDLSDQEAMEIALVENLQRQDLSPIEEAEGYRRLLEEFAHTQEDLGRVVGKSRSHVANTLRLLNLPQPVKELVEAGSLSAGHARALLNTDDPVTLAQQVVKRGLNVRQTEKLAQGGGATKKGTRAKAAVPEAAASPKDVDTLALERDLSALLGLKVAITFHGRGGELVLHYTDVEQLDDILQRLSHAGAVAGTQAAVAAAAEDELVEDLPFGGDFNFDSDMTAEPAFEESEDAPAEDDNLLGDLEDLKDFEELEPEEHKP